MKKIAFVGGGTGWHATPIVAVAKILQKRSDVSLIWIVEANGIDDNEAKKLGIPTKAIVCDKIRRYFSFRNFVAPFRMAYGFFQVALFLASERPNVIFSKGGPVAVTVVLAAAMLRIPLAIHESDTIPGKTNVFSARFAKKIFLGFESAKKYFPEEKTEVIGQILDPVFFEKATNVAQSTSKNTEVLVFCGSQWSTAIFEALLKELGNFPEMSFTIVLGTKNSHFRPNFEAFSNAEVRDWADHDELVEIFAKTDVAITRWGVTTIAEMQLFDIRMCIIPLPTAANNHQYHNALEWKEKYGHVLLEEKNIQDLGTVLLGFEGYKKTPKTHAEGENGAASVAEYLVNG